MSGKPTGGLKRPCLDLWFARPGGKSPEKEPLSVAIDDKPSTGVASSASSKRRLLQDVFRQALRVMDKQCCVPGCPHVFDDSFDGAEAAHIIPNCILDVSNKGPGSFYAKVMSTAKFSYTDIDSPRNGMLLCLLHHTTFDRYRWTLEPMKESHDRFRIVVRDANKALKKQLNGKVMDFSRRWDTQRPTAAVVNTYNFFIYRDEGKKLRAVTKKDKAAGGGHVAAQAAAAAAGGGAASP